MLERIKKQRRLLKNGNKFIRGLVVAVKKSEDFRLTHAMLLKMYSPYKLHPINYIKVKTITKQINGGEVTSRKFVFDIDKKQLRELAGTHTIEEINKITTSL